MRNRVVWLIAALLASFLATAPGYAQVGKNMLPNGGFESGSIAPYGIYYFDNEATGEVVTDCEGAEVPEGPAEGNYCLHVVVPPPGLGENDWDVGMTDNSYTFKKGKRYVFSCFMKCKSGTLQVRLKPERGEDPYDAYNDQVFTITSTWQEYSVITPIMTERVTPASPTFHFNFAAGDFWIDDIRLTEEKEKEKDYGATYTWTGAFDHSNWNDAGNWDVEDSIYNWTWPNEQFLSNRVNEDCDLIEIANGNWVNRAGGLEITGASDGSSEAVLTIDNNSSLELKNNMSIAKGNNVRGRVEVGNGGYLSVSNLSIAQGDASAGALNVVNATLAVRSQLTVGGYGGGAIGNMGIENSTAKVLKELFVGRSTGSEGMLEIKSGLVQAPQVILGLDPGATGKLEIKDGALRALSGAGHLVIGQGGNGTAEVKGGAVGVQILSVGGDRYGTGTLEIKSGTVDVGMVLDVALEPESAGVVEIRGGILNLSGDLCLAVDGDSAAMSIKGGEVNIAGNFQMNYNKGPLSELVMDGGVVNVAYGTYLNWGAGIDSRADFTLNGGTWNSGKLCVGATTNGGNACLTINGGTMVTSGNLVVGNQSSGESRIILNGGLLQAEDLIIDTSTDSLIVYHGGELWINKFNVNEAAMQDLMTAGLIDAAADYEITTVGDYTVLRRSGM